MHSSPGSTSIVTEFIWRWPRRQMQEKVTRQGRRDTDGGDHHERGVHQGALHALAQAGLLFHQLGEPLQDLIEQAAQLAGAHHVRQALDDVRLRRDRVRRDDLGAAQADRLGDSLRALDLAKHRPTS